LIIKKHFEKQLFDSFFCMFILPFSILILMSLPYFGSTQSVSFECQFTTTSGWGTLGPIYRCDVSNSVYIASPDAAHVDSISGTHLTGYNFENVEAIQVTQGQIHYFPRGLNKFFKNLKGILIASTGLKEIHQSDLKDYPKLMNLYLYSSNLEVIEENLFEFNPNLNYIYFDSNKISHIDPKVFVNLIKLNRLYLTSNTCINMYADNNPTQLQNVIRTAQIQCTKLDYSELEQNVKYLEMESKFLNSADLRENLENLENQIQNSKFPNFFREKLKGLNAVLVKKERYDVQDLKLSGIEEKLVHISDAIEQCNKNYEDAGENLSVRIQRR